MLSSSIMMGVWFSRTGDSSLVHSALGVENLLNLVGEPNLVGEAGALPCTEYLDGEAVREGVQGLETSSKVWLSDNTDDIAIKEEDSTHLNDMTGELERSQQGQFDELSQASPLASQYYDCYTDP